MHQERVSENVYWFQSEIYAQVTAGVIVGSQWAVVIDTLAVPEETLFMRNFIEEQLNVPVRYIINTHYHADHSWGNCFFPGATVIAHHRCRQAMQELGIPSLEISSRQNPTLKQVKIILPHLTFSTGEFCLRVGKKTLVIMTTPGHSQDGISVLIEEDRVLFAGDAFMPLPYIVDGDVHQLRQTITAIGKMGLENVIQGHGDIILRGEIDDAVKSNILYLDQIQKAVAEALNQPDPISYLKKKDVESCSKSRIYLGGLAEELHQRNLRSLYQKRSRQQAN
mgnify:CR=1 FL=1